MAESYKKPALIIATIAAALAAPAVFTSAYSIVLLNQALIFALIVLGLNFVYGFGGVFSLAQAAFWGIGAYTSALLTTDAQMSFPIGFLGAVLVASLFGLFLGIPTLKLRSHYLTLATLAFAESVRLVLMNTEWLTHGAQGIRGIPPAALGPLLFDSPHSFYYLNLSAVLLSVLFVLRFRRSRLGRALEATRDDELAAAASGVDVTYCRVLAFVLSAFFAGAAGSLWAHFSAYISPETFDLFATIRFVSMLLIGGAGTALGPVVGALLLTYLPEWLRFLEAYYMAIYGLAIVLILVFAPKGLVGIAEHLGRRLQARGDGVTWRRGDAETRRRGDGPHPLPLPHREKCGVRCVSTASSSPAPQGERREWDEPHPLPIPPTGRGEPKRGARGCNPMAAKFSRSLWERVEVRAQALPIEIPPHPDPLPLKGGEGRLILPLPEGDSNPPLPMGEGRGEGAPGRQPNDCPPPRDASEHSVTPLPLRWERELGDSHCSGRGDSLRTQHPELSAQHFEQDSGPRTQDSESSTQHPALDSQNSEPRTQNPEDRHKAQGTRLQHSAPSTQHSEQEDAGLRTQDSKLGAQTPLLVTKGLTMAFGGLVAVRDVDLSIADGSIHGIIGPNGSGKTTILNLVSGIYRPTAGEIVLGSDRIDGLNPSILVHKGIARTFQNIRLFQRLTVLDNVKVAGYCRSKAGLAGISLHTRRAVEEERRIEEEALRALEFVGLAHATNNLPGDLPYGQQRLVELARALASNPRLLLLDEPGAGMSMAEKQRLVHLVREINRKGKISVIVIEHDMKIISGLCQRVTVLNFGEVIAEGPPGEIRENEAVIEAYLGRSRRRARIG